MENEGESIEAVYCDIAAGSWSRLGGGARRDVPALQAPSGSAVSGGDPIQPRTGADWPDFVFRSTALRSAKYLLCDVPQQCLGRFAVLGWAGPVAGRAGTGADAIGRRDESAPTTDCTPDIGYSGLSTVV